MNSEDKEAVFVDTAKANLDEALRSISPATSARLRLARHHALEAVNDRGPEKYQVSWMLPAAGFAAVSVGVLALFLLLQSPEQTKLVSESVLQSDSGNMEDLELLASSESIEFYEDLEFYGWLLEQNRAG